MTTFIVHLSSGLKHQVDADTPDDARKIVKGRLWAGDTITKVKVSRK